MHKISGYPWAATGTWTMILCIVISAAWFKFQTPVQSVFIDIKDLPYGKNLVDEADIEKQLMNDFKTNFVGWQISELEPSFIEESIQRNPFVKSAHVFLDALNRLHIVIQQREPAMRVQDENNMSFYIDTEGYRMPLSRHYTARVKVATGYIPRFKGSNLSHSDSLYTSLMDVSEAISEDPFYEALVEQIYVDRDRMIYVVPKIGEQKILLGRARQVTAKLDKLKIFMKEGLAYEGWQVCETIDLRFSDQIVCKKMDSKYSLKTQ